MLPFTFLSSLPNATMSFLKRKTFFCSKVVISSWKLIFNSNRWHFLVLFTCFIKLLLKRFFTRISLLALSGFLAIIQFNILKFDGLISPLNRIILVTFTILPCILNCFTLYRHLLIVFLSIVRCIYLWYLFHGPF